MVGVLRVSKETIENELKTLNYELETAGSKFRYSWHTAYGRPHLKVCHVENFKKEYQQCSVILDEVPFTTRHDLLNAIKMIRYAIKR